MTRSESGGCGALGGRCTGICGTTGVHLANVGASVPLGRGEHDDTLTAAAQIVRYDAESGLEAQTEVWVSFGREYLNADSAAGVREIRAKLRQLCDQIGQAADELERLEAAERGVPLQATGATRRGVPAPPVQMAE